MKWAGGTLGDMATVVGGGTPSTRVADYWDGNIPWVTPAEVPVSGGGVVTSSDRSITEAGLAKSGAKLLPSGSVLVTSRASIGNCAIAGVPVATNQGFASLVPRDGRSTRFLYYWVQQHRDRFLSKAAGSTFLEISASKVRDIEIAAPTPTEQAAIGESVSAADDLVAVLERMIAKKLAIKQGMRQQLLTGRTRLPGFADPWEEVRWSDVVSRRPGNGEIKGRLASVRSATAPFPGFSASGQDVWLPRWDVQGEGIVVSAVGSRCGRSFLARGRWSAIANTHIVLPVPGRLDSRFALLHFDDESFWNKGGSGQPFVQVKSSLARRAFLPPFEEQRAIADVFGEVDHEVSLLRKRLVKALSVKTGMMQELLTGRTRLPVGAASWRE